MKMIDASVVADDEKLDAHLTEAFYYAVEKCREGKPGWHKGIVGFVPSLTIGTMDKIVRGVKDWKVVDGKLIIT